MTKQPGWLTVSAVGLLLLILAMPGAGQAAATRHSGTVVAVDRDAGTIVIEELGPWRVRGGQTVITRFTVKLDKPAWWTRARRATGAGPLGWEGEFIEVPQDAWGLRPGEYATIELTGAGKGQAARRVTVSEFDTR